jgi:hypothetical protein
MKNQFDRSCNSFAEPIMGGERRRYDWNDRDQNRQFSIIVNISEGQIPNFHFWWRSIWDFWINGTNGYLEHSPKRSSYPSGDALRLGSYINMRISHGLFRQTCSATGSTEWLESPHVKVVTILSDKFARPRRCQLSKPTPTKLHRYMDASFHRGKISKSDLWQSSNRTYES